MFKIEWTFQVTASPGSSVMETPVWGDDVSIEDEADKASAVRLITRQFAETLAHKMKTQPPKISEA